MVTTRITQQPNLEGFRVARVEERFDGSVFVLWTRQTDNGQAIFQNVVVEEDEAVNEWYANDVAHKMYMEAQNARL